MPTFRAEVLLILHGQTLFRTGRYRLEMISTRVSLAWPDPFSRRALSITDDKRPCEKGLVRFTALTCSRTQHSGAGC